MDSTYSGRLLVCNDRHGVAFCSQEKLNVVYKDDAVRCVPFSKFRGTKTVEIGETDPSSYPSTVNRARLVAKFPHIAPKEIKGQEFAKLLATPCQASSIPFDKPEHNGTAWEVGLLVDGPSLKCVQYNSLLVTVSNKKVLSIPLARAQGAALKRIELESQDRHLYSPDDVSDRVENALEGKGALLVDDADFVESLCVNPKANGTMIVVEFPIRMTRYGVVVENEDGSFDVIYRRRIPYSCPIRISYSDFIVNARKVKLWKPPRDKIEKLGCEYKIYPRAEVAERARSAVKHGAVKDSAIGNLEEGFPPEKFLLQMCVHTDDWRLLECKVNLNKVLVRLYQPAKELKAGDVVCSESQNFGVVHSITDEGDVLLGHFGPEPGDEKSVLLDPLGEEWKGCMSGNPQLTSLEEFSSMEKPSFVYRVEYMKCDAVWDVATIQKRIVLAVEGNLLPDGKPLLAHPVPKGFNSKIVQIESGQNRLVPAYHQMNWNSEDWAFWIVRGQSDADDEDVASESYQGSAAKEAASKLGHIVNKSPMTGVVAYGLHRAQISHMFEKGLITEAERDMLVQAENQDIKRGGAQLAVMAGGIPIALIPVAGLPLSVLYAVAVSIQGSSIRKKKKEKSMKDAIWSNNKES